MVTRLDKLKNSKSHSCITRSFPVKHSSKAVSEVIVSLLLLAITVIGGIFVFVTFTGSDFMSNTGSTTTGAQKSTGSIKITGFDTRDKTNLFGITGLSNTNGGGLGSGEYIVLKVRNDSPNAVFLENVQVNEISHALDTTNSGGSVVTFPPDAGEYSIVPTSAATKASSAELGEGKEVRLVIRLSGSVGAIETNKSIRIAIDSGGFDPTTFIIPAGSAR